MLRVDELSESAGLTRFYLSTIQSRKTSSLFKLSEKLYMQSLTIERIAEYQRGEIDALPMRFHQFPHSSNSTDILVFQFHLILRNIRFQCTEDISWKSSNLLADYESRVTNLSSQLIKPSILNRLKVDSEFDKLEAQKRLDEVLDFECPSDMQRSAFLQDSFRVAIDCSNGTLGDGVILRTPNQVEAMH